MTESPGHHHGRGTQSVFGAAATTPAVGGRCDRGRWCSSPSHGGTSARAITRANVCRTTKPDTIKGGQGPWGPGPWSRMVRASRFRSARTNVGVDPDDSVPDEDDTVLVRPRVLIVDDHVGFRSVAHALLQTDGFDVVGEAADGAEALVEAVLVEPDLVLLDVHLPGMDGFAVSEQLSLLRRPPKVVLTSSSPIADLQGRLERCVGVAFLPKDELSGRSLAAAAGL